MINTSYGVSFFVLAYARSSFPHARLNATSCLLTSCFVVVGGRNSYVAGKRNPSSDRRLSSPASSPGSRDCCVNRRYCGAFNFVFTLRRSRAIRLTAVIRSAICSIVNPSGKMIFRGFGGGGAVVGGGGGGSASRTAPSASAPSHATN